MTFKEVLRKLNNRYVYATLVFLLVILVIDQFSLPKQRRLNIELREQKQQIEYLTKEIDQLNQKLDALEHDTAAMEKEAREQFFMKRDNEIIYHIETQK